MWEACHRLMSRKFCIFSIWSDAKPLAKTSWWSNVETIAVAVGHCNYRLNIERLLKAEALPARRLADEGLPPAGGD
jgi:hypothetical protein